MDKEIIVKFKTKKDKERFIGQMMDGVGENLFNFSHWHEDGKKFIKKYDEKNRLICIVDSFDEEG